MIDLQNSMVFFLLLGLGIFLLFLLFALLRVQSSHRKQMEELQRLAFEERRLQMEKSNEIAGQLQVLFNEFDNMKQDQYLGRNELYQMLRHTQSSTENSLGSVLTFLQTQYALMDSKQGELKESMEGRIQQLRSESQTTLEYIRQTVDERLQDTLNKRMNESFSLISERLEAVNKSLGEMQGLQVGVQDLQRTLSNVKTRGIWGELQLEMLLEQVLNQSQYESNVQIGTGSDNRVEFALLLPNASEKTYLPIDSKFPKETYVRLQEAYDSGEEERLQKELKEFNNSIRVEAKRIYTKYVKPPQTTDFAVMFLPVEGLYAECVRQTDLVEELQHKYRVMIAGPTTMLALLNSLQLGFKSILIEQRSHEIRHLLSMIKLDFAEFFKALSQTQQRIHQANDAIENVFVKSKKIQRHLENVESEEINFIEN